MGHVMGCGFGLRPVVVRFACAVLVCAVGWGDAARGEIRLLSGVVDVASQDAAALRASVDALVARPDRRHVIVQFSAPIGRVERDALRAAGVRLLSYLDDRAYFASLSVAGVDVAAAVAAAPIRGVTSIPPMAKVHPRVSAGIASGTPPFWVVGDDPPGPDQRVGLYVVLHRDVSLTGEGVRAVVAHGATVLSTVKSINGLVVVLPMSRIAAMAEEDAVQWVEWPLPHLDIVNDSVRAITEADTLQAPPYGLDGSGVSALVYDGGTGRVTHADFGGRLTALDSTGPITHATHVAGTIGGDGTASGGQFRGMAPGVTLLSYGFEWSFLPFFFADPGDIEADYDDAINNHGADISNNSIGTNTCSNGFDCNITGDYGVASSLIDAIVAGSLGAPFRVVWANGNERGCNACTNQGGADPQGFHSTAPPACAKNQISVGALNSNDDSMTGFSSWGPCDDGRLRPDVSAPGCQSNGDGGVRSPSNGNDTSYATLCGTSMASPTVCGLSSLLLGDFRTQFPGQPDMRNSTLKALLAHTAEDLGNPGPDYTFGYGSVRIQRAVDLMRQARFVEDFIDTGQVVSKSVTIEPGDNELRVTLAWDDAPAAPNAEVALVNDLDLRAISPSGTVHFPWTLDPGVPSAPAEQGQVDRVNNVEQVFVPDPEPGVWTVEVVGFDVPDGVQAFSLVGDGPQNINTFITVVSPIPPLVLPDHATELRVEVLAFGEEVVPGSVMFHYRIDGEAFVVEPMTALGGDLYGATLPGASCGETPEFFFSAAGTETGVTYLPPNPPITVFTIGIAEPFPLFADDFETHQGWIGGAGDSATQGNWVRVDPIGTAAQPEDDHTSGSGTQCWVTGQGVSGGGADEADVDGGQTNLYSPQLDVSDGDAQISYWRWYSNSAGAAPGTDVFVVDISNDNAQSWTNVETVGPSGPETSGGWVLHEFMVSDFVAPTALVRLRFIASDSGDDSVVEAAIDDFMLSRLELCVPLPGDFNGDGSVDLSDHAVLVSCLSGPEATPDPAPPVTAGECLSVFDFEGDGDVDLEDTAFFMTHVTATGP